MQVLEKNVLPPALTEITHKRFQKLAWATEAYTTPTTSVESNHRVLGEF